MRRHRRLRSAHMQWLTNPIATVLGALAIALLLAGCAEKPQDQGQANRPAGTTVTHDTKPWDADPTPFTVAGYVKGDKAAYENAQKQRTLGQHEYVRIGDSAK